MNEINPGVSNEEVVIYAAKTKLSEGLEII
jgi:hypothetical protein